MFEILLGTINNGKLSQEKQHHFNRIFNKVVFIKNQETMFKKV